MGVKGLEPARTRKLSHTRIPAANPGVSRSLPGLQVDLSDADADVLLQL